MISSSTQPDDNLSSSRMLQSPSTGILSHIQNSITDPKKSIDYYDQLRFDPNVTYKLHDESNVISIEVPAKNSFTPYQKYRLCHLSAFLPLTAGNQRRYVEDEAGAIHLAAYHFNHGIGVVVPQLSGISDRCNVRLTVKAYDTGFSPIGSCRTLSKTILGPEHDLATPHPIGLIGAYRSAVSMPLATLAGVHPKGIVQISHASTSTDLDYKDQYPLFGRTISSTAADAFAVVEYLHKTLHVTHCGVIFVKDPWGLSYLREFQKSAGQFGMKVITVSIEFENLTREDVRIAINKLKNTKYQYFYGIFFSIHYDVVMEEAYAAGIAGGENFWLMSDGINYNTFQGNAKYKQGSALANATHGIGFFHSYGAISSTSNRESYDKFLLEWSDMNHPDILRHIETHEPNFPTGFNFADVPSLYAFYAYDAAVAYGLAACALEDTFTGRQLYDSFLQSDFEGASGPVRINNVTGGRNSDTTMYVIENVVANDLNENGDVTFRIVRTAFYTQNGTGSAVWMNVPGAAFNYSDGTLQPPAPLPPVNEEKNLIGIGIRSIGLALSGSILLVSLLTALWTYQMRNTRVVRASQPTFLIAICIGIFVAGCGLITSSLEEPIPQWGLNIACMTTLWLYSLGFVTAFSALFAKTLRINKIFKNQSNFQRVQVEAKDVMLPFVIMFTFNIILLTLWTAFAPLKYERVYTDLMDTFGRPIESYGSCTYTDLRRTLAFGIPLLVGNISMVILANIQAYRARRLTSEYAESKYIAIAMGTILQLSFIGIPLMIAVWNSPPAKFFMESCIIFVTCQAILLLMFVPKEFYRRELERKKRREKEVRLEMRLSVISTHRNSYESMQEVKECMKRRVRFMS